MPTTIKYIKGDATKPIQKEGRVCVIPHICNDIGGWGKGFVLALSRAWKEPELEYKKWFKEQSDPAAGPFELGNVQFVTVSNGKIVIANIIGQHTIWKSKDGNPPIRYNAVESGLEKVAQYCLNNNGDVHAPKFGSDLAGGDWNKIEQMIIEKLCSKEIPVTVYLF